MAHRKFQLRSTPLGRISVQTSAGFLAVAIVTAFCYHVRLGLTAPLCLNLCIIVVLSLQGSFLVSAFISVIAVGALDYYFAEPLFSPLVVHPLDVFALALFLLTSAVVTTLVARLRSHAEELARRDEQLQEQMAEVKRGQDQLSLARVNRIMLMGEMTASIAHEINQPLTGILANAGTAARYLGRDVPDLDEVRRYLGLIVRDGRRAGDIISRIRALARKAPPRASQLDINDTILEVARLIERELHVKQAALHTELASDLPFVAADRVQLQQVLLNLIMNALEAMTEAGTEPREITIASGTRPSNEVFVEVRDCGPGFAPADLDRIFNSFYTTKAHGMGMGLSISRSIVEAHGGRLTASPNVPQGAAFRFTLPIEADSRAAAGR